MITEKQKQSMLEGTNNKPLSLWVSSSMTKLISSSAASTAVVYFVCETVPWPFYVFVAFRIA